MKLLKNGVTRRAILFTLMILIVYRLGAYIVTPLVNASALVGENGIADNIFALLGGGNTQFLTLFALGVGPYITASIVIQLLENDLVPKMADWKHQGVDGQNKRSNWTKYSAILFAFLQAFGLTLGVYVLKNTNFINAIPFTEGSVVGMLEFLVIPLFITAGSTILIWLADRITEKGIGNGMSVLIMVGILTRIPAELITIAKDLYNSAYNGIEGIMDKDFIITSFVWMLVFIIFILLLILVIYYTLAYRKVKINYVKNSNSKINESSFIPIKLNPAGVIPIIFVSPLMQVPLLILRLPIFSGNNPSAGEYGPYETVFRAFFDLRGDYWFVAMVLYFVLIVLFSIMYSYIQMNPETMSKNLEKQQAYIVGVRPGEDTERYLGKIITRTTVYGGTILALLAILPILIQNLLLVNILETFVNLQLLGTGLIITVNVLVQTYQSMENKVESKTYKKLF